MEKILMTITLVYDEDTQEVRTKTKTFLPPATKKQLLEEFAQNILKTQKGE